MESVEGVRFHPTKEQIFRFLEKKRIDPYFKHRFIQEIDDICSFEPWDLAKVNTESEAYIFYEPCYKFNKTNSVRKNRRTEAGSWNETGKGSNIKLRNGHTVTKKIFTFYRHVPDSKKSKTQWVMHEFSVKDNPSYKKRFVLCHIRRKWDNKQGFSTPDEGESSQQLGPLTQLLPTDHLISTGNHIDEHTVTSLNQHPPNHSQQTFLAKYIRECFLVDQIRQNTIAPQLPNMISYTGNQFRQNAVASQQPRPPNHDMISFFGNHIEQNTGTNQQPLPLNQNTIFSPWNHIQDQTLLHQQLLRNHNLESQLLQNQSLATNNVAELGEHLQHGEYNGLNNASFSAPQLPNIISYTGNHNAVASQRLIYEGKSEEDEEEEAGRSRMARQNERARMRNFKRVTFRDSRPLRRRRKRVMTSSKASSNPSAGVFLKENKDVGQNNQNPDMNYNNCNYYKGNNEEEGVVKNDEKFNIDIGMEMEVEVESRSEATIENLEEEKGHDKKVGERVLIDVVEDDIKERHVTQAEAASGGGCGELEENKWANYDGIDDWPLQWSDEKEWPWMGIPINGLGLELSNPQWEYVSGVGWIDKRGPEI